MVRKIVENSKIGKIRGKLGKNRGKQGKIEGNTGEILENRGEIEENRGKLEKSEENTAVRRQKALSQKIQKSQKWSY